MTINFLLSSFLIFTSLFCSQEKIQSVNLTSHDNKFLLGNEVLLGKNSELIKDKRIGLITNPTGVMSNGALFLDSLNAHYNIVKIFTPEHGLRGDDEISETYTDRPTGISIVSLYGSKKKPDAKDLVDVDVLVYDIQDVGARFYTYINTMFNCMESSVENEKEMIICDRPIIPDGNYVDGFMLNENEKSLVGMINVPIAYGMTCAELARYINAEYFDGKCILQIVLMDNYSHSTDYTSLNLPWIKPSPSMYFPSTAVCYAGTCLFEGTNYSEGRGTDKPFEYTGAPYCDGKVLADELNTYKLNGVTFENISFTPTTIASNSNPPKYVDIPCEGVFINVTDKKTFEAVKAGIAMLASLKKLFPDFKINQNNFIDKLAGTKDLRIMLNNGSSYKEIIDSYESGLIEFKTKRSKYLYYN